MHNGNEQDILTLLHPSSTENAFQLNFTPSLNDVNLQSCWSSSSSSSSSSSNDNNHNNSNNHLHHRYHYQNGTNYVTDFPSRSRFSLPTNQQDHINQLKQKSTISLHKQKYNYHPYHFDSSSFQKQQCSTLTRSSLPNIYSTINHHHHRHRKEPEKSLLSIPIETQLDLFGNPLDINSAATDTTTTTTTTNTNSSMMDQHHSFNPISSPSTVSSSSTIIVSNKNSNDLFVLKEQEDIKKEIQLDENYGSNNTNNSNDNNTMVNQNHYNHIINMNLMNHHPLYHDEITHHQNKNNQHDLFELFSSSSTSTETSLSSTSSNSPKQIITDYYHQSNNNNNNSNNNNNNNHALFNPMSFSSSSPPLPPPSTSSTSSILSPPSQFIHHLNQQQDESSIPRKQNLRYETDAYTPRWVRYTGQLKQGYCDSCRPHGRWLQLKNSAYWYHKQFFHGISSVSGQPFTPPLEKRVNKETDVLEGLCHQCLQFVPICNSKRKNSVLWYRHAHKCHIYNKPAKQKQPNLLLQSGTE